MASPAPTVSGIPRERLVDALDRLQASGTWTPEQAAALLEELDRAGAPRPAGAGRAAPPVGGQGVGRLAEAAAYAGAALVAVAGAVLVGQQWEELGRSGRIAVFAGVTLVLAAVGAVVAALPPRGRAALLEPAHAIRRRLVSTALTVASATAAGTAALVVPDHGLLAAGITAVVAVAAAQFVAPSAVSEVAALGAVIVLAVGVLSETEASLTATVLTVAVVGGGWALLARSRLFTVPTLALALGLAVALYAGATATFTEEQPTLAVGIVVLALLAVGGLGGYVRTARWPLAAAGVLAIAALVLRISSESLSPVLAVLLTGLVLLAAALLLVLRGRRPGRG
jgi:hypothetical protein